MKKSYTTILTIAGSDGSGAVRQLERIVTGWRLRRVAEPLIVCTHAQTPEAIAALAKADPLAGDAVARAIVDARLACAEGLLRRGKRDEARAIYNQLATAAAGKPAARAIELAATRGIVACLDTTAS
jgi:thioredoxin-like negative regulator of GroEL